MVRSINVTWVPRVVPLDAIFSGLLYGQPAITILAMDQPRPKPNSVGLRALRAVYGTA